MRYFLCPLVVAFFIGIAPRGEAQADPSFDNINAEGRLQEEAGSYAERLERERYKTALARERAQQASLNHQTRTYEYQRRQQDSYYDRTEQERRYEARSNDISSINQVANTVAGIARQVQVLSSGRPGW